jgi:hypothetical protein
MKRTTSIFEPEPTTAGGGGKRCRVDPVQSVPAHHFSNDGVNYESDTACGIVVIVAGGKILHKMRKNPVGWRIEELQAVAEDNLVGGADRAVVAAT